METWLPSRIDRAPGDDPENYFWPVEQQHPDGPPRLGDRDKAITAPVTFDSVSILAAEGNRCLPRWVFLPRETAVFEKVTRRWRPVSDRLAWPDELRAVYHAGDTLLRARLFVDEFGGRRSLLSCIDSNTEFRVHETDVLSSTSGVATPYQALAADLLAATRGVLPRAVAVRCAEGTTQTCETKVFVGTTKGGCGVHGSGLVRSNSFPRKVISTPDDTEGVVKLDPLFGDAATGSLCFVCFGFVFVLLSPVPSGDEPPRRSLRDLLLKVEAAVATERGGKAAADGGDDDAAVLCTIGTVRAMARDTRLESEFVEEARRRARAMFGRAGTHGAQNDDWAWAEGDDAESDDMRDDDDATAAELLDRAADLIERAVKRRRADRRVIDRLLGGPRRPVSR